jgi:hypothetical protein
LKLIEKPFKRLIKEIKQDKTFCATLIAIVTGNELELKFLWQKHENKIIFVLKMISFKDISISFNECLLLCVRN